MIDKIFRAVYQRLCLDPLVRMPFLRGLTPMKVTLLGLVFGVLTIPLLALGLNGWAILSLLLSGYFDTLDGALARHQKSASDFGAVFDITSDRVVEFSVLLGLFLLDPITRGLPTICMLGSVLFCITTFLVVGIFSENKSAKSFYYSPGLIERAEAFSFWIVMIMFPGAYIPLAYTFTALVCLTAMIRLLQFSRNVHREISCSE